MTAYAAAMAGGSVLARIDIGASRSKPGSVAAAVAGYLGSGEFSNLAEATRINRRLVLDRFRDQHGEKSIATIQRKHVELWVSSKAARTPAAAVLLLVSLRELMRFSVRVGLREDDPTEGVRRPRIRSDGFYAWTDEDIAGFEAVHPVGTKARLAMCLALYTGQRKQTIVTLGRQHVRDGVMRIRQQKTRTDLVIPVLPELQAVLDTVPRDQMTFVITRRGTPFNPSSFGKWFKRECRKAGLPARATIHGLRKAAARRLAESGHSASVIASITGHLSLREVARYTASADQAHLARLGIEALARPTTKETSGTNRDQEGVNPGFAGCKPPD
jgi:integrase